MARTTRPCPRCKTKTYKSEGCNHITCRECARQGNDVHWCWLCGVEVERGADGVTEHFGGCVVRRGVLPFFVAVSNTGPSFEQRRLRLLCLPSLLSSGVYVSPPEQRRLRLLCARPLLSSGVRVSCVLAPS